MRVLHVTPAYESDWHLGGTVRSVTDLCQGLAALGHKVCVCCVSTDPSSTSVQHSVVGGVEVYRFPSTCLKRWSFSWELAKAVRGLVSGFDIVHLTSFWHFPGVAAGQAARRCGVPCVISPLGTFFQYAIAHRRWTKAIYLRVLEGPNLRGASAVHYTAEMEREASAWYGLRQPSFVTPNPVRVELYKRLPSREEGLRRFGLPERSRVVSFLGRLHPVKALDRFLPAFAHVAKKMRDLHLILAGPDDGHAVALQQMAKALLPDGRVIFPGMLDLADKRRLFAATDASILVSHHENFGLAAAEAMAAGVPVLVSNHVCICREISSDGAGRVVSIDERQIAEALGEMLSDQEGLKRMGAAGRQAAERRYDCRSVARLMAAAYEDVFDGERRPECRWLDPRKGGGQ